MARRRMAAGPVSAALLLGLSVLPAAAGEPGRTAAIQQVGGETTTSERSKAALDQISPRRVEGKVDQIDPSARPRLTQDASGLAPAGSSRRAANGRCEVTPAQAAILDTLRAQGRILADDCEHIEWVAIAPDRSVRDERRVLVEAASGGLPERLTYEGDLEREREEAERQARIAAGRAVVSNGLSLGRSD